MNKPGLLILDDEVDVLNALARTLRKEFELYLFSEPDQALALLSQKFIPLILSDMRMPSMDGATFLQKANKLVPLSKRFILTGHSDLELMRKAVNDGKIEHYFCKPWDTQKLTAVLKENYAELVTNLRAKAQLKEHQKENALLVSAHEEIQRNLKKKHQKIALLNTKEAKHFSRLRDTFQVFIDLYANAISLHVQETTGHSIRIASQARQLATGLECEQLEVFQVFVAGMLYQAGKLKINQTMLAKPVDQLNQIELATYEQFYQAGADMLLPIGELKKVAELINHISERVDGLGRPSNLSGNNIPLGARILALVIDFDNLINGRTSNKLYTAAQALAYITTQVGSRYDKEVFSHFCQQLSDKVAMDDLDIEYPVDLIDVQASMILSQDIAVKGQPPLLTKGSIIEQAHVEKLKQLVSEHPELQTIYVYAGEAQMPEPACPA